VILWLKSKEKDGKEWRNGILSFVDVRGGPMCCVFDRYFGDIWPVGG